MGTELDSGSEEYREYKELAENIYRDYCGAETIRWISVTIRKKAII